MRKGCAGHFEIAILPQFLAIKPHFVRKGCAGRLGNRNFTSFFGNQTSFRAKGLRRTTWKSQFYFDQFLAIEPHFVRRGCAGQLEIAILPQFLAIEPRFVRKGCVSCCLVGTARAPVFRREIEKKERARGQEEKMWRCEDVKMWRCEDEKMWRWADVKMWRCEDEQMWRWEDVKMWRCEDEKMWRWEDVKMRRCEDVRMWICEDDEKMWRWEDVKMRRFEDEKMWRWADVKMRRCEDVKMRRCEDEQMWRCEDVKMSRCEDEKMWRWENVKMRRWWEKCEDEKMWRWEDVKMRRWETDPHYWKNPALRRSRGKSEINGKAPMLEGLYTIIYTRFLMVLGMVSLGITSPWQLPSPARPKDELGEILDKSRVRKFRFGAEDEDDVDYNMRSLDVWCWPMVKKLVNNGKSVNHQYWLFWPWHMKNLEQNPTNSSIWLGKPMVLGCYPLDTEITPRLQQLAVSAKPVDRRLETRIGAGRLLPPTTVKWF